MLEVLDCLLLEALLDELSILELFLPLEVLLDELSMLELFWLLLDENLLELDFSLEELFLLLLDDFRLLLLNDEEYLLKLEELVPFNAA